MTTDAAIAQAFRELVECDELAWPVFPETFREDVYRRARELDAEKGGRCDVPGVISAYCCINGCKHMADAATPPAQAAEAVERVARAIFYSLSEPGRIWDNIDKGAQADYLTMALAAIAAMQAGEVGGG